MDHLPTAEDQSVIRRCLFTDKYWDVRYWVARNPNATELMRRLVLMKDHKQNEQN